ncbi:molybdate transport system substrate-binding protein [Mesocricetibacter intestinalis]|uniref:Molybdate transport system substrate-binding protein n=1 Tax=Mesocricetibacter intestinalis TaxID=1521930 RepID=A0A4R6V7G1_9PAST|nr:molybdate ABC transporter substrate-binding protein [Mesocricetibacter intestinalis]TDQ57172.1 molybdate transport system substrate-binding protein [Mesocricetibacter intestinalis]
MLKFKKLITAIAAGAMLVSLSLQAKVTVFAAASMTNALQEVAAAYKKVNPEEEIVFSFASSSVLARQISEGAPADIFVSADQKWMNYLAEKQWIIADSRSDLVGNRLVMIAPKSSKITALDLTDEIWQRELKSSFLAVGDPEHVPAGIYAKSAFIYLNQWSALENKLARTDNVRKSLLLVEKGEAPLGVVYATDAAVSSNVKVVAVFPPESHAPVEYPVALVKAHDNAESRAFLNYMKSAAAKEIYAKFGFSAK